MIKSFLLLIGAMLLNFMSLFVCCQFSQMFDNAANCVSPPLRPIVPSSLNSPYISSVPYIGACPYRSGVFMIAVDCFLLNVF